MDHMFRHVFVDHKLFVRYLNGGSYVKDIAEPPLCKKSVLALAV